MKNVKNLTASEILKAKTPDVIFAREGYETQFNILRSKWHEDKNPDPLAHDVFIHLFELNEIAKSQLKHGTWGGISAITVTNTTGKTFRIKYYKEHIFELGKMYIARKLVAFVIEKEFKDLYKNAVKHIKNIRYPDKKLDNEFRRFMPKIQHAMDLEHDKSLLVIEKPEDLILLQDLLDYLPDHKLPPRQAAWIGSSLLNMAVFFDKATNLTHNSIMSTTVFVGMKKHYSMILGGWWYAEAIDEKLNAIPAELIRCLPKELFKDKRAKTKYDRFAIKSLIIKCLGDASFNGSKLLMDKDIANSWVGYLRSPSTLNAIDEYTKWYQVLGDTFGKRKFEELNIDSTDVY